MRLKIPFMIAILSCVLWTSLANSYELEGVWRIDAKQALLRYMKQRAETDPRLKKLSEEKKQAALKKAASMKVSMTIRFANDASFEIHMSHASKKKKVSGTWKTDAPKKSKLWRIQTRKKGSDPESIEIEWITDNTGRLRFLEDHDGLVGWMDIERIGSPKAEPKSAPTTKPLPDWETVGYWTYDAVDGRQLTNGLVLRKNPGSFANVSWVYQLELTNHSQLLPRERILWPVQINRKQKKICVDAPYPTYSAIVDLPGGEFDGEYAFSSCKGGSG